MKVILTTTIRKLGKVGEIVSVKPGFARNFLFPNDMALRDNKKNAAHYEKIKDEIKKNEETKLVNAQKLIEKIKNIKIIFHKEADEKDQLYGSISKKEIIDFMSNNDVKIKSDDLLLRNPIRSIGEHTIEVNPYEGISEEFLVTVIKN